MIWIPNSTLHMRDNQCLAIIVNKNYNLYFPSRRNLTCNKMWCIFEDKLNIQKVNLTLLWTGGGYIVPPPSILCSGALNIDLRGPRFWYNSYFIVTM